MNTKRTRFVAGVLSAIVLSSSLAMALGPKLIFTNLTGQLHVLQRVPCGDPVDVTTSIADGRMEVTPSQQRRDASGAPGAVMFDLSRLDMFFTPFTVQRDCHGITAAADFREIGVRLARGVTFTAEAVGGPEARRYRFSIPKDEVLIYESVMDNLPVQQPETAYQRPSEDVTGQIDLRRGTARLHITLSTEMRFRAGCVGNRCLIDQVRRGRQTADVEGTILNPATDTDRDRVPDLVDNCPLVPNREQSTVLTPVITAPPNMTLSSCKVPNIGTAQATDVCHARPVVITNNAPARFSVGRNVITWSAADGIDPIVTAQQVVTIDASDRTPPALACRPVKPEGERFLVAAVDDCSGRTTIQLGSYRLDNNEVIKIEETKKPGVRLVGTVGDDKIRHFQVGRGEAVILATDAAGNVARVACGQPSESTPRR